MPPHGLCAHAGRRRAGLAAADPALAGRLLADAGDGGVLQDVAG
jgi:hypothetical protein